MHGISPRGTGESLILSLNGISRSYGTFCLRESSAPFHQRAGLPFYPRRETRQAFRLHLRTLTSSAVYCRNFFTDLYDPQFCTHFRQVFPDKSVIR